MVVNSDIARTRCCLWCMGMFLKLVNYVFSFIGMFIMAFAFVMYERHESLAKEGDIETNFKTFWFEVMFASVGLFSVVIGATGISGADCGSKCCLGLHVLLLFLAFALEGVIVLDWQDDFLTGKLPEDATGEEKKIMDLVDKHQQDAAIIALVLIVLQVLALITSFIIMGMDLKPPQRTPDTLRQPLYQPMPSPVLPGTSTTPNAVRNDPWSRRMREKYGFDTGRFSYDPEADSQGEAESAPAKKGCAIM